MKTPREVFEETLLQKRQICIFGIIDREMADRVIKEVLFLNAASEREPIKLYLSSQGGGTTASLDIFDIIKSLTSSVIGVVVAQANSNASLVLQACSKRLILPHSTIKLHNLRVTIQRSFLEMSENILKQQEEIFRRQVEETRGRQEIVYDILASRAKVSRSEIKKFCCESREFSASEAMAVGLVDAIA